jgi:hypothetical protein
MARLCKRVQKIEVGMMKGSEEGDSDEIKKRFA